MPRRAVLVIRFSLAPDFNLLSKSLDNSMLQAKYPITPVEAGLEASSRQIATENCHARTPVEQIVSEAMP